MGAPSADLSFLALSVTLAVAACGNDEQTAAPSPPCCAGGSGGGGGGAAGGEAGQGGVIVAPGSEFDRFCGAEPWDSSLVEGKVGALSGEFLGVFTDPPPAGALETMKVIPEHPFWVRRIRVAFGGDQGGPVRLRLMHSWGRSYPASFDDIADPAANLMPPVEFEVTGDPDANDWIELDVSAAGVFLEPTQHYLIVNEKLDEYPLLAVEEVVGESSRGMLHMPNEETPYGLGEANFRMELEGEIFCGWADEERYFALRTDAAFSTLASGDVSVTDLNGDGHDDVVAYAPGPRAFLGDGTGSFSEPAADPFDELSTASLLVFADLDNDGARDAFAMTYVTVDGDGDHYTLAEGDCNDTDASVRPGASEIDNGLDDDCDGTADDGTNTLDGDDDGVSIAEGDCDDTRAQTRPGIAELLDGLDNDCDGETDEDFVNRIARNDGQGRFVVVAAAGVETVDPSTTAGFGDANRDGYLDLYWGNWLEHYPDYAAVQDRFVVGIGDGTFTDQTAAAGLLADPERPCYGVTWNDYDGDGWADIFVGNYQLSDDYLWQNQQNGTFLDVAATVNVDHDDIPSDYATYPGGHSYGASFGDFDSDGDMDLFVPNLSHPRTQPWADPSMFYVNGGAPDFTYEDRREDFGILYDEGDINSAFADYDNDGDLDLAVLAIYPTHYLKLYRNDGAEGFVDVTYESGVIIEAAGRLSWVDVDEDGDLDLVAPGGYSPSTLRLFENRVGQLRAWIELELEGTTSNRDAVGARISLTADGLTQLRDVWAGEAHRQQHSHWAHFGLGDATTIDSLTVRWPGGATETITGASPRGRYRIVEGSGEAVAVP